MYFRPAQFSARRGKYLLDVVKVNVHDMVALKGGLRLTLGLEVEHFPVDFDVTPVETSTTHWHLQTSETG